MRLGLLLTTVGFGALMLLGTGCAASEGEATGGSSAEITGSLRRAQAIAIRDAYVAAQPGAFTVLSPDMATIPTPAREYIRARLEGSTTTRVEGVAVFPTTIGKVFVVETSVELSEPGAYHQVHDFFDEFGTRRLYGYKEWDWDHREEQLRFYWNSEFGYQLLE